MTAHPNFVNGQMPKGLKKYPTTRAEDGGRGCVKHLGVAWVELTRLQLTDTCALLKGMLSKSMGVEREFSDTNVFQIH